MIWSSFLTSCKTTPVYIYPDIAVIPEHAKPVYPPIQFTAVDNNHLLISLDDSKALYKYIVSMMEYALLLETDIKYYVNVTRQPSD